jgi:hypothetical protein
MNPSILLSSALAALSLALGAGTAQAADVGVSISISQPGVYGRIDIGQYPQPAVVMPQPVWVQRAPVYAAPPQPVYLWVPPGHQKHWDKHCGRYNACGVPVYFVREDWYQRNVYRGAPGYRQPEYRQPEWQDGRGDRDERGDRGEHDRGHGHGRDHGKGHRD